MLLQSILNEYAKKISNKDVIDNDDYKSRIGLKSLTIHADFSIDVELEQIHKHDYGNYVGLITDNRLYTGYQFYHLHLPNSLVIAYLKYPEKYTNVICHASYAKESSDLYELINHPYYLYLSTTNHALSEKFAKEHARSEKLILVE